jgi:hypothetical protein
MAQVKSKSRWIREQVDESTGGCELPDPVKEARQDHVAKTLSLVFWQNRHVEHVEAPTAVSDESAHPDCFAGFLLHDVDTEPAAPESRFCLIPSAWAQA